MVLKLLAYLIIPTYTILFTKGYNWLTTNFSVIGNLFDKKLAFITWGILVGLYFYLIFRKLRSLTALGTVCSKLIPAALILLFCAVTTPYLPEKFPLKSFLHIIFAFVSTVLLLTFLLIVIWNQYKRFPGRYFRYLAGWAAIIAVSVILLAAAGIISSALEIFITITTVILSDRLCSELRKDA